MVWCCQPVASAICGMVAPLWPPQHGDQERLLAAGAALGLRFGRRRLIDRHRCRFDRLGCRLGCCWLLDYRRQPGLGRRFDRRLDEPGAPGLGIEAAVEQSRRGGEHRVHVEAKAAGGLGDCTACRVLVDRAARTGRITREPDGGWDLRHVERTWQQRTDGAQQRRTLERLRPVPEAALGSVRETLREQGVAASGAMSFVQARTANEVLKAQERKLRLSRLKGGLVERSVTTTLLSRLARQERDAWLQWPARIAATLAADLGVETHALQTALESQVRAQLASLIWTSRRGRLCQCCWRRTGRRRCSAPGATGCGPIRTSPSRPGPTGTASSRRAAPTRPDPGAPAARRT
jgi:hypothetical protein